MAKQFDDYSDEDMARLQEYIKLREKASASLLDYKELVEELAKLRANERFLNKELARYEDKRKLQATERAEIEGRLGKAKAKNNAVALQSIQDELDLLEDREAILGKNTRRAKKELKNAQSLGKVLASNLNTQNLMGAAYGSTLKTLGSMAKKLYEQKGYLLEQQKAVKASELQMGLLAKQSEGYRKSLFNASLSTNQIGVDTKSLSQMQATYSQEVGRTVVLTESGNQAMAELAKGTVLGTENAAQFAANMEKFGHSVETSRDFMEETMNISTAMGLSAAATTENVNKALKTAQTYNFAGGVKGVQKMALIATKLKLEVQSIAGLAEKAFNPEGAIEMAANLSVLGGAWAQLGDPFSLMFKSRNDLAGLTEDIARAASAGAEFNDETGEFEIASMELHRLREVAKATGISMDELTMSARNAAKFTKIKSEVGADFDDDIMDFIASKGRFDAESKEFKINIDGKDQFVKDLHLVGEQNLRRVAKEQATLKQRALNAQTFDDQWNNVINQFKATILPGFNVFADTVLKGLVKFSDWIQDDKVLENIQSFATQVGTIAAAMAKFATNNPWMTLIGLMVGKAASWAARGRLLGMGFNSVAKTGATGGATGGGTGAMSRLGKNMKSGGFKGGGIAALGGLGVSAIAATRDDQNDATGRGLNIAGQALTYGGTGAMLGSMVLPGIGTAIGGALGAGYGAISAMNENKQAMAGPVAQDFIARPGQEPMKFSAADTLIGMKKGGGIDNALSRNSKSNSNSSGKMNINFTQPLKIEGKLTLESGGQTTSIDLNNPILMRELSRMVQEEITVSMNGKRNPNPAT